MKRRWLQPFIGGILEMRTIFRDVPCRLAKMLAVVVALSSLAAVVGEALGGELALAVRGAAPEYAIILPSDTNPAVQYAAEELRDFAEQLTGVRLPIATNATMPKKAIVLELGNGEWRMRSGKADSFRLCVEGQRLRIIGGGPRGVLYGVYELLERFGGCRWYSSWCSKIPALDVFAVSDDLDDTQIPAFEMRDPGWFDVMIHPAFAARLRVNDRFWDWKLEEKYGGNPYRWGAGLGGHTFKALIPPKTYFEEHPEYFAFVGGARRKDGQICLTNPEVLAIATSNLLARIRRDPGAKFYSVSQNDNWHRCQCDGCKAVEKEEESASGPIIRFVNAIAEKAEKEFPDALVHTFAYNYSTKPPAKTKPRKNVVVQLCTDACEHARPIRGNAHGGTVAFQRNLEGWGRLTDKLFIWDYTTDFTLYTLPWPNVLSLQDNLRLFRENGVKMVFAQGDNLGHHADWAELKAWLLAKWMWNPDLPMEGLLEDFFQGYYGAAAPYVRRYFDEVHRRIMMPAPNGKPRILTMYDADASRAIDKDFLAEAAELFRKAEESVNDDPMAAYNVRMAAFPSDQLRFDRWYKVVDLSDADGAGVELSNAKALAQSFFARRAEAKNLRLVETVGRDAEHANRWAEVLARKTPTTGGGAYGEVEDWALELRYGGKRVSDPKAADGKAIMLYGNHYEWSVFFQMRFAAFKPDAKYRLRVRLRAETVGDGEAFWAGIERGGPGVAKKTSEVSGDYAWYDVAVWKPNAGQYFWIGPGRFKNGKSAIKDLYIDKIAFDEQVIDSLKA